MLPHEIHTGASLDKIADMNGIVRAPGETDDALRRRIRGFLRTSWVHGYDPAFGHDAAVTIPVNTEKEVKCECGAHALGFTQKGDGHSSWCPLK